MEGLYKLTNALSDGTIPDPLWPPLPRGWGLQLSYPLLSQEQVKLWTSNLAGTFIKSNQIKIYIAPYVHEDSEALGPIRIKAY